MSAPVALGGEKGGVPTPDPTETAPVLPPHPTAADRVYLLSLKHPQALRREHPKTMAALKAWGLRPCSPIPEGSPISEGWFSGALPGSGRRAAFPSQRLGNGSAFPCHPSSLLKAR